MHVTIFIAVQVAGTRELHQAYRLAQAGAGATHTVQANI